MAQLEEVTSPVLPIRDAHDGMAGLPDFFGRPPNRGKRFISLPHALHYGLNRARFWQALHAFPSMSPVAA